MKLKYTNDCKEMLIVFLSNDILNCGISFFNPDSGFIIPLYEEKEKRENKLLFMPPLNVISLLANN